ncbi:MAG: hypothetical protein ACAI44_01830 [Candidatus Sericytochromatia bacterium]
MRVVHPDLTLLLCLLTALPVQAGSPPEPSPPYVPRFGIELGISPNIIWGADAHARLSYRLPVLDDRLELFVGMLRDGSLADAYGGGLGRDVYQLGGKYYFLTEGWFNPFLGLAGGVSVQKYTNGSALGPAAFFGVGADLRFFHVSFSPAVYLSYISRASYELAPRLDLNFKFHF